MTFVINTKTKVITRTQSKQNQISPTRKQTSIVGLRKTRGFLQVFCFFSRRSASRVTAVARSEYSTTTLIKYQTQLRQHCRENLSMLRGDENSPSFIRFHRTINHLPTVVQSCNK